MILVCGEALIDLFVTRSNAGGLASEAAAGGSPFNVAVALASLGRPTALLAAISDDPLGQFLSDRLAAAGVSGAYLRRTPLKTTLSVVAIDPAGAPTYSFYGEAGADRALTQDLVPANLPEEVTAIAAGSYSLAVEPSASAVADLVRRQSGRRVVSLDPNVRPGIIGDLAAFRRRFEGLAADATIVRASAEDIELLYGTANLASVAWDWLGRGPRLVVITRGADGAIGFTGSTSIERPAPRVDVVDTVGAGDTFHAALLAALDMDGLLTVRTDGFNEASLAKALDFASAAAAIVCTRRGADPPTRQDVIRFMTTGG